MGAAAGCVAAVLLAPDEEKHHISREEACDCEEEMKGIREEMKALRASNDEILALSHSPHPRVKMRRAVVVVDTWRARGPTVEATRRISPGNIKKTERDVVFCF